MISKALIDNDINHEDLTTILNYRKLKESIRTMKSEIRDIKKNKPI